jgi:tRNA(adenine34) deaminase
MRASIPGKGADLKPIRIRRHMQRHDQDLQFMHMALQQAALAPAVGEVPIAAVLVHDGHVLASAHNDREASQDPTAHAEMIVIRKAAEQLRMWRLTDTTLYVTLEPCAMCAGAIVQSRIARLVFGAWDPKAGACGSIFDIPAERRLNHRVEVLGGLLEQESQALLQHFFRSKRRHMSERNEHHPKPVR